MRVQPDRQRIFNVPLVLVILVGLMLGIHLLRQLLPLEQDIWTLIHFGFVPGRFTYAFDPGRIAKVIAAAQDVDPMQGEIDRAFLNNGKPLWWTPLTYVFLHANWAHVGLQCALARGLRRAGRAPVWLAALYRFCIGGAVAGALAHLVTHLNDLQPVIGASAIDSAMMAAAVRFMFQPTRHWAIAGADRSARPMRGRHCR